MKRDQTSVSIKYKIRVLIMNNKYRLETQSIYMSKCLPTLNPNRGDFSYT